MAAHRYAPQEGLPAAFATTLHVPSAVAPLAFEQKSQEPLHAPLQHTPSAQKPVAHSRFVVQTAPLAFCGEHWFVGSQ